VGAASLRRGSPAKPKNSKAKVLAMAAVLNHYSSGATWGTVAPIEHDDAYPKLPGRAIVTGWPTCTDSKFVRMAARLGTGIHRRHAFF
jgi:hypothetical protein